MLGPNGYPVPGRHYVSVADLHRRFVADFSTSKNRQPLFTAWNAHGLQLSTVVHIRSQWIGGSFASDKLDPSDLDMITLYDGPHYDSLSVGKQGLADNLLSGPNTRLLWGIDSYSMAEYPEDHPAHADYLSKRGYWDWWFSRIKGDMANDRGYLEVRHVFS